MAKGIYGELQDYAPTLIEPLKLAKKRTRHNVNAGIQLKPKVKTSSLDSYKSGFCCIGVFIVVEIHKWIFLCCAIAICSSQLVLSSYEDLMKVIISLGK